jgi:hypothetical protein
MCIVDGMRNGRDENPVCRRRGIITEGASTPDAQDGRSPVTSPKMMVGGMSPRRRKTSRASTARKLCVVVFDLVALLYVVKSLHRYYFASQGQESGSTSPTLSFYGPSSTHFQHSLNDVPSCEAIDADDIMFTLAIQLSENRLWMMQHHCQLWGVSAPISVALWTTLQEAEVLDKLQKMGCDPERLTLQTLSSAGHWGKEYPINTLRNLALTGVATSHVLSIDVDFWESEDLFDTLHSPHVRKELAQDPKQGIVIPTFEIQSENCAHDYIECREKYAQQIPSNFEELVIVLGSHKALPFDPTNFSRQGSTDYRKWMKQGRGQLIDLPCVASNQYQPYVAVRFCESLPPFQAKFYGHGRNNMAWMMHLRRLGFRLQQVGGSFLTHFPHQKSKAKEEWEKTPSELKDSSSLPKDVAGIVDFSRYLRGTADKTFLEFRRWLDTNVPDNSRLAKCEDFEDDDAILWVNS